MLQAIRERATGILGYGIIALISVVFALWGIENYITTTVNDAIAVVNGEEISIQQFQDRFNRYRSRMQAQFGNVLERNYFDQPLIRRQFLDSMIEDEVIRQAAVAAGLDVTGDRLIREINDIEAFKVAGEFSSDVYLSLLAQQGMTPQRFEQELREGILIGELESVIGATAAALPGELARARRLTDQQRTFRYVTLSAEEFAERVTVADEDVEQYYRDRESEFMEPERVTIEYLELAADALEIEAEASEATLLQRYEDQKSRFLVPERRLTSHILIEVPENAPAEVVIAAEERARGLAERARAGEAFETLAKEHSDDAGSAAAGGDLDWVERGVMVSAFEEALFAMEAGEISDPVNTVYGFHVIKLREIEPARGKSFEEAREELAEEYRDNEAERRFLELQDRLYDLTYEDQGSLAPAAAALELEIRTAGPFSRAGGEGLAADPQVLEAAFSDLVLEAGSNSDPLTLEGNRVVVLRLRERFPETLKPLEDVSDEIRATLVEQRSRELARAAAEELLARVRSGSDLAAEADAAGRELKQADAVGRSGGGVDPGLVAGVFRMPWPGEDAAVSDVMPFGGNQFAVVSLQAVIDPPAAEAEDPRVASLGARLARGLSSAEAAALKQTLRERAKIQVMEDRLTVGG